ncbi:MAG: 50S ribosomal protein L19 [Candidatus Pacebacteria bacterium]|nr:50S ribosomal protein L19 [Candidatus Paceibacterota bacterium]
MTIHSPINVEERKNLDIRPGDTIRVWQKIVERYKEKDKIKEKKRLQAFEGLVLARKHGGEAGATIMVRRVASGVGVERIFPLYSPTIDKIEMIRRAKVRQAKLYHIRDKAAKEISREMRRTITLTRAETEAKVKAKEAAEAEKADEAKARAKEMEAKAEAKAEKKTEETKA